MHLRVAVLVVIVMAGSLFGPLAAADHDIAHQVGDAVQREISAFEPIQPGRAIHLPLGCTLGFLFRNVGTGQLAFSTPGYCGEVGKVAVQYPQIGEPRRVGVVIAVRNGDVGENAALIGVDEDRLRDVRAAVLGVGGPCGEAPDPYARLPALLSGATTPAPVLSSGWGPQIALPRLGLLGRDAADAIAEREVPPSAFGLVARMGMGDAGAPVRVGGSAGGAVGILTHVFVYSNATEGVPEIFSGGPILPSDDVLVPVALGTTIAQIRAMFGEEWMLVDDPACPLPV